VIPLDQTKTWYRYHHLFQELLQRRLREGENIKNIQALHSRASTWLAGQGLVEEAIHHALASGEVELVVQLIEKHRVGYLNRQDWQTLRRWLAQIPKEVIGERPALLLTQAWIAVYQFNPATIQSLLNRTEKVLSAKLEELPRDEVSALQGELDTLHSFFMQTFDTKPEQSLARAEKALERLPVENATARGMAQDFKALAFQFLGRIDEAIQLLEELLSDPLQPDGVHTQAYIALCWINFCAGNLSGLTSVATRFLSHASKLKRLTGVAWANYFLGYVTYERNELQKAVGYFSAVADLDKIAVFLTYHSSMLLLAKAYRIMGQKEVAQDIIVAHQERVYESGNQAFIMDVVAQKAWLSIDENDTTDTLQWASRVDPETFVEPMFTDELASLYWAQILTDQVGRSSLQAVQEFLVQRLALVESRHNVRRQIKIMAQLSLVHAKLGQNDRASKQLKRCLQLAQQQSYMRTFIDLGSEMSALLGQMVAADTLDESLKNYVSQLLALFPQQERVTSPIKQTWLQAQAVMSDPLTQRECEVLVLLGKQLKYREIAQSLVISMPTTKKHISHIYAKLGAKNRGDAIERAKSLGILR
jgi:LuxR family maltose regulon positive regulatory protein